MNRSTRPRQPHRQPRRQRGVASLIVVMVLFFVVSLVAAYTSRNLIFEQRTSANQYRSTQAIEAAEAGIEWALSMLNHGRINDSCQSSTAVADLSFRQRYLSINTTPGSAGFGLITAASTVGNINLPSCVFDGTDWACSCPNGSVPSLAAPTGSGVFPAFRVRFRTITGAGVPTGTVIIESNGCTRLDDTCLNPSSATSGGALGIGNEGTAYVAVIAALAGGPAAPPSAAITAMGSVDAPGGTSFTAINGDPARSGITVQASGTVNQTVLNLSSLPGTPGEASVVENDLALAELDSPIPGRLFPAVFNVWSATFDTQPGVLRLDCTSPCTADELRDAISLNPRRPIWLASGLSVDTDGDIGAAGAPVALRVSGSLSVSAAAATVHGLLYVDFSDWTTAGGALNVVGATVVAGNVGDLGGSTFTYDNATLEVLRVTSGSFVRVPGSWRDYP